MTKKEIIEKLVNDLEYNEKTQKELEAMSKAELEELLNNLIQQESDEGEESTVEELLEGEKEEVTEESSEEDTITVLRNLTVQLGIFKEFVYVQQHKGSKIIVTNLGPGSVYAGDEYGVVYGNKEQHIGRNKEKVFEGTSSVTLIASSQPEVQIIEVK